MKFKRVELNVMVPFQFSSTVSFLFFFLPCDNQQIHMKEMADKLTFLMRVCLSSLSFLLLHVFNNRVNCFFISCNAQILDNNVCEEAFIIVMCLIAFLVPSIVQNKSVFLYCENSKKKSPGSPQWKFFNWFR